MNLRKIITCIILLATFTFISCTEEDENCTETVCPEGFNNCFEKPCE